MVDFHKKVEKQDVSLHDSIRHAEAIWTQHKDILWSDGHFYKWGGQFYHKIDEIDFMIETAELFPAFNELAPKKQDEIMKVYKRYAKTPNEEFNKEDGLCFRNKYLDLKTLEAHKHEGSRVNTILVDYDYDPEAQCPLWIDTLQAIFSGDNNRIISLQEFFGYCLSKNCRFEKAMFLYGEGGTGKSVILEALKSMIGLNNVSFVSLRHFSDSMRLASLQNKLINICSEVSGRAEDYEETFKKVVSMEEIDVSPKYIAPFSFSPFCKLIFAVNNWPRIADKSSAFFRRMLILGVNNVFSEAEQDKELKDKLKIERAGILNWAIIGLQRIREQRGFYVTEEMKEEIEDIKLENNPIAHWAKEHIDIKKDAYITKPDAYQKYG